jgi:fucose permease
VCSSDLALVGALLLSIAIVGPGLASDALTLGVALFVVGLGNGGLDVSMNAQAVIVERAYGRPIMSAFHAFFSIGGAGGAFAGGALISAGLGVLPILALAGGVGLVLTAVGFPWLLASGSRTEPSADADPGTNARALPGGGGGTVWLLGLLAFLLMLVEGVANDWSALQIKEHLSASAATAAFGYGAFAVCMTVGRLCADRLVQRFGPTAVVRWGAAIGAVGVALLVLSPWLWLNLAGWGVLGLGLSGSVPQIFSAAGNLAQGSQGTNMARVVGLGYVGFLAGPAAIGAISQVSSVTMAMLIPLALCGAAAALAPTVTRGARVTG